MTDLNPELAPATAKHRLAFCMLVGPNDDALALDNVAGIRKYYPDAHIYLYKDGMSGGRADNLADNLNPESEFLIGNPENLGFTKLPTSFARCLRAIQRSGHTYSAIVRIDSDSMVCGPGLEEIARQAFLEHGPGVAGCLGYFSQTRPKGNGRVGQKMKLDRLPVGPLKDPRATKGKWSLRFGKVPYWKYMPNAIRNGYQLGDNIIGPVMVFHPETLRLLDETGPLDCLIEPFDSFSFEDDVLVSAAVASVGHKLIPLAGPGIEDRFCIYFTLPEVPNEYIAEQKFSIVHSLKANPDHLKRRAELRALCNARDAQMPVKD